MKSISIDLDWICSHWRKIRKTKTWLFRWKFSEKIL